LDTIAEPRLSWHEVAHVLGLRDVLNNQPQQQQSGIFSTERETSL